MVVGIYFSRIRERSLHASFPLFSFMPGGAKSDEDDDEAGLYINQVISSERIQFISSKTWTLNQREPYLSITSYFFMHSNNKYPNISQPSTIHSPATLSLSLSLFLSLRLPLPSPPPSLLSVVRMRKGRGRTENGISLFGGYMSSAHTWISG